MFCEICEYSSDRSGLQYHHIIPKELGGSDGPNNRVYLCPNCHSRVFVDGSKSGNHSIKKENSIKILGWYQSTDGKILRYINEKNEESFQKKRNLI